MGTLALEHMADYGETPESERRDAIFRVLYSYVGERPYSKENGDLLFRDVIVAAKIVKQSKNKYDLQHENAIYNELCRRCPKENALTAQKALVEAACLVNVDEKTLHTLLLQLGCAYIRAGQFDEAEKVFSKQIQKPKPMDNLCRAECLRKQQKYAAAEEIAQQVAKTQFSFDVRYPSLYAAMANAIRAQAFIEQKRYESALPLLLAADKWFSKSVAQDNTEIREFTFVETLLPDDVTVLSNLVLVYEKLGRKEYAQRTRQTLLRVKFDKERNSLTIEKDELTNASSQSGGDTETAFGHAKRFVEICLALEKKAEKRTEQILNYAESLIKNGKPKTAELCLDACAGSEFSPDKSKQDLRQRLSADRILVAEERGDLNAASALLKDLRANRHAKSSIENLRFSEVEARLALLSGDYALAENKSRPVESMLSAMSMNPSGQHQDSPRDKFVKDHEEAILDRVQSLNSTQKFTDAARLARLLLVNQEKLNDRTGSDSAANLAFAYAHIGHNGLGAAFEQEAMFKDLASFPMVPSRYMADAKEKLAILSEMRNNAIRAGRYHSEARAIRRQLNHNFDSKEFK